MVSAVCVPLLFRELSEVWNGVERAGWNWRFFWFFYPFRWAAVGF
jgi:hypothetical protein